MKIIRVLVYEGTPEWMQKQLGRSLPDGVKDVGEGNKIKAITLGSLPDIFDMLYIEKKEGE